MDRASPSELIMMMTVKSSKARYCTITDANNQV
jgi:hypothetical protein